MTEHSKITLHLTPLIVADRQAWEHKTGGWRLKLGHVNHELQDGREMLFMNEVYFPKMKRILTWMRLFDVMPDADWQYLDSLGMIYPNDLECQEWLDAAMNDYWQELYSNDDWYYEEFKREEEVWEFCSKPEFVTQEQANGEKKWRPKGMKKVKPKPKPVVRQMSMF